MVYDVVIIGSGINSLVCASLLSKRGKKVLVLERSKTLGGCIQSEFVEDCVIDTFSTAYPLFVTSGAYPLLKDDLDRLGVRFVSNDVPTGVITSDKEYTVLKTDRQANINAFNQLFPGDGDRFDEQMKWVMKHSDILFTILGGELMTFKMSKFLVRYIWKHGLSQSSQNAQEFLKSVRSDFPNFIKSKALEATLAPWILHSGLSPESPMSSCMAKVTAMSIEMVGLPLVEGGSYKIVNAFQQLIQENGGICMTEKHVERILVSDKGKTQGVQLSGGEQIKAKYVVANVTPTQLYGNLLIESDFVKCSVQKQAREYRYGKGNMQIHLILRDKPEWIQPELQDVTYVHLSDGIDAVSQAVNEAERQLLPAKGTICIAQPTAVDPSRAKGGKYVLWIQIPECPNYPIGDAGGGLMHLTKGDWTKELSEAYADSIIERIAEYIPNIENSIIYKRVMSPKELSQHNLNLVDGDPYSGRCDLEQYLLWRPISSSKNHQTDIKNLYHIGASTHPGPGLSGGSGFLVANQIVYNDYGTIF